MENPYQNADALRCSDQPFDPLLNLLSIDDMTLFPPENIFQSLASCSTDSFANVSKDACDLQEKFVFDNRKFSNDTTLRDLARFVVEYLNLMIEDNIEILRNVSDRSSRKRSLEDQSVGLTCLYVFHSDDGEAVPHGHSEWTVDELQRINNALVEFFTHCRTRKGEQIMNINLKTYLFALQRAFESARGFQLNLLKGSVFAHPSTGLMTIVDNIMRREQATGRCSKSHNTRSEDYITNLYNSTNLSKDTGLGMPKRLVFNVSFMIGFSPSELWNLFSEDGTHIKHGSDDVWRVVGQSGSKKSPSKTQAGGWRFVNVKPKEVFIWNCSQLESVVSVYKDLIEYMELTQQFREGDSIAESFSGC